MGKNANFVSHKKSKQKIEGKPQLPSAASLVEGEIAINFAKDVETLSIKNESGDVVTFSSDNYYTEQKLGSGFTGANSAVTVTDKLNEAISVDQVIDSGTSASTHAVSTSAVYKAITDNELVWTNAYVAMSGEVSAHTANTEIHVTAADKEKLHTHSNKSALDSITGNVGTMAYEDKTSYSSATEVNTALGNKVETTALTQVNNTLTAHTADTTIHFTTGTVQTQIDNSISGKVNTSDVISAITPSNSGSTAPIATNVVAENELVMSNALNDLNERKLDASAYTPTDLSNYYTKSETSGATEISNALGGKVNSATFTGHTADTTMHFTTTEKTNLDSLATNIAAISGITAAKVSNWDSAYTDSHTHANKSTLDAITASSAAINSLTGTVGTMAFKNASSYSSATEVNTAIANFFDDAKYELSGTTHVINFYNDNTIKATIDADDFIKDGMIETVSVETSGSTSVLVITWNTDAGKSQTILDIGDIFEADNYYTKSKTSGATELANAFSADRLAIEINAENIAANKTAIDTNIIYIAANKAAIETNATDIQTNATNIQANKTEIMTHTADTTAHFTSGEKAAWGTFSAETTSAIADFSGQSETIAAALVELDSRVDDVSTALAGKSDTGITITTASGLTGGGNLSANRTIGLAATGTAGTYKQVVVDAYGRVTSGNTADNNSWRSIKVNGTNFLTDTSTALNLSAGTNVTLATGSTGLLTISATDTNNRKAFFGTCSTAAATAKKEVTLEDTTGWELKAGTIVGVKFTNSNTASGVTIKDKANKLYIFFIYKYNNQLFR